MKISKFHLATAMLSRLVFTIVIISSAIITFPWRILVYCLVKIFRPDLKEFVHGITRIFGVGANGSLLPSNLIIVVTVDGHIELRDLIVKFNERIMEKRDRHRNLKFGKFKEYIKNFMGYSFWTEEDNFALEKHMKQYDYKADNISCFDDEALSNYLSQLFGTRWKMDESWWRVRLVNNFQGKGKSLIILHWQHSIGDGFTMRNVAFSMFDHEDYSSSAKPKTKINYLELSKAMVRSVYETARFKLDNAKNSVSLWDKWPNAGSRLFHSSVTKAYRAEEIKIVQAKFGVGFQTVLLSAVSAALQTILEKYNQPMPRRLLADYATVPPNKKDELGMSNEFCYGYVSAPLISSSDHDRLFRTEECFRNHKTSCIPLSNFPLSLLCTLLPATLMTSLALKIAQPTHIIFSSFPYLGQMHFQGQPVSDLFCIFEGLHPFADLVVMLTGSPNQVRFGISINACISSLPKSAVLEILKSIENKLDQLIKESV